MDLVAAIQILALHDVLTESEGFRLRSMHRWYSREFHEPLSFVESSVPLPKILQAFFEERFKDLEPDKLEEVKKLVLESDEQRAERLMKEDIQAANEEEFHKALEREAAALKARGQGSPLSARPPTSPMMPESKLPDTGTLPTDQKEIQMVFITKEELERQVEDLGSIPIPKNE